MTFPPNRTGWKKPGPRITPERYDAITAAVRETPNDIDTIASRFDLSPITIQKIAERMPVTRGLR